MNAFSACASGAAGAMLRPRVLALLALAVAVEHVAVDIAPAQAEAP